MGAAVQWPLAFVGAFSRAHEARALGALATFWILEDFFWFALNPAYGVRRFRRAHVPWHPHWICGLPADYLAMGAAAAALFAYGCWPAAPGPA